MLLKTKLLIGLTSLSVVGGTGAGIYYGVTKEEDATGTKTDAVAPSSGTPNGAKVDAAAGGGGGGTGEGEVAAKAAT